MTAISADFHVHEEVRGRYCLGDEGVRADCLCFPREHLVRRGFVAAWFVVETKHLDFQRHESKRLYEAVWQAVTYRHSEFIVEGQQIRPAFATVCLFDVPPDYTNTPEKAQRRRWQILLEFGLYANVGCIELPACGGWSIHFGQGRYFDSETGLSRVPRGLKRYVGRSIPTV